MKKMKKLVLVIASVLTIFSSTSVFAAQSTTVTNKAVASTEITLTEEEQAIADYISAMESRADYIENLYKKGLISENMRDRMQSNIQANIDYVLENGLPVYDNNTTNNNGNRQGMMNNGFGNCSNRGGNVGGTCGGW